ncbi:hypothetical protein ABPG74_021830 [Tetrahymena malaccensis]
MFQQQFTFQFGKSNIQNRSLFGGVLSAIITIFSTFYLGYLLNLYFGNKLLPKVTTLSRTQQDISLYFDQSPFMFQILLEGQLINDFQDLKGKKYLNIDVYYKEYYQNSTNQYILPTQDCQNVNNNSEGYICIDFNKVSDQTKQLIYYSDRQSSYEIIFSPCDGASNCSSKEEAMNVLMDKNTFLSIVINTQQFNYSSSQFQQNFITEVYQFDDNLVLQGFFLLQKTISYITKGMIFQDKQQKDHLGSYQRSDQYISRNKMEQNGYDVYGMIELLMDQNFQQQEFQFVTITEVLSQFFSLLNILMALGVVISKFSKNSILQNLCVLYLKEQFKCTAAYLIQNKQKYPPIKNKNNSIINEVIDLQEKINQTDFLDRDKHLSIFQKFKKQILKIFRIISRNSNQEAQDILNKKIMDYTLEQLDIHQLYRQLIKLNMAVKLLLTKDQYAALQFCGCSLDSQIDILQIKSISENQNINLVEQKQDQPNILNITNIQNQTYIQNQQQNQEVPNDLCISPQKQENNLLKDQKKQSLIQTSQLNLSIQNNDSSQKDYFSINLGNKNNELITNQFDKFIISEVQLSESNLYTFQDENDSQIQTKANKYQIQQNLRFNSENKINNNEQKPSTIMQQNFLKSYICSRDQEFKGDQSLQIYGEQDKVKIEMTIQQKKTIDKEQTVQNKETYEMQTFDENKCDNIEKKIDQFNLNEQAKQIIDEGVKQVYQQSQNEQINNTNLKQKQTNNDNQEIYQNHLEELNKLDKDKVLLQQEFFKFIAKFEGCNNAISQIDKNIKNSIIINLTSHKFDIINNNNKI